MARIAGRSRPRALITGASAGIGRAFARRLATDGYDLVVVARRQERLEELRERLHEANGANVEVLAADLTVPAELQEVERRVADGDGLAFLVNNAPLGLVDLAEVEGEDRPRVFGPRGRLDALRPMEVIETNVVSVALSQLPLRTGEPGGRNRRYGQD